MNDENTEVTRRFNDIVPHEITPSEFELLVLSSQDSITFPSTDFARRMLALVNNKLNIINEEIGRTMTDGESEK
jgi:hypothetical protein